MTLGNVHCPAKKTFSHREFHVFIHGWLSSQKTKNTIKKTAVIGEPFFHTKVNLVFACEPTDLDMNIKSQARVTAFLYIIFITYLFIYLKPYIFKLIANVFKSVLADSVYFIWYLFDYGILSSCHRNAEKGILPLVVFSFTASVLKNLVDISWFLRFWLSFY